VGDSRENIYKKGEIELFKGSKMIAQQALQKKKTQVVEHNIIVNGKRTLVQVVEIPVKNPKLHDTLLVESVGFALDFSELQDARERLKRILESQAKLLESSANAIAIYSSNKKLEYFNRAFVDLWKLDQKWLESAPSFGDVLETLREKRKLPEQADFAAFKRDNLNMFTSLIEKREDYYYLSDGRVIKLIIIPHEDGGLLFYYEDLTKQITLERSFNTFLSVQKSTLDNLNEAVAVYGEDGRLKLYNPVFERFWFIDDAILRSEPHVNEILQFERHFFDYSDSEWEIYRQGFFKNLNSRIFTEHKLIRKDDMVLLERFTPLPDGATLVTYFDITDKENVEKSLLAERKAYQEADKIKTNFLKNVSYELRSPLTSVQGFAEILMMDYLSKLEAKPKEYLKAIFDSTQRLKQLIDNIIDVASLDAGVVSLKAKPFDIAKAIDDIRENVNKLARKKNITLNLMIEDNIGEMIGDKERIEQVIETVINNSIMMSENSSEVTATIRSSGENILLISEDFGDGIPESEMGFIFDQFYKIQSDAAHTTGLSLYLAKRLIELHGGYIAVDSEVGNGTKFIVELPKRNKSLL
jgi:signal transduction histidine kinase